MSKSYQEYVESMSPLQRKVSSAMGDAIHHYFIPDDGREDEAVKFWAWWELAVTDAAIAVMRGALLSDEAVEAGAEAIWNRESGEWDTTPARPWSEGATVAHPRIADYYRHMATASLLGALAALGVQEGGEA